VEEERPERVGQRKGGLWDKRASRKEISVQMVYVEESEGKNSKFGCQTLSS
jgi:hypothetical protein